MNKIYFWRTLAGDEVDFIIDGPRGFHAFEIKRSAQIKIKNLKVLRILELITLKRTYIFYF